GPAPHWSAPDPLSARQAAYSRVADGIRPRGSRSGVYSSKDRPACRLSPTSLSQSTGWRLLADDDDLDGGVDVGVQVQLDLVLADGTQRAGRHAHFLPLHRHAGLGHRLGDVGGADGAEQLALIAGLGGDGHLQALELRLAVLGSLQRLAGSLLELGPACFEFLDVLRRGRLGLAGRHQVVAAVAGADLDLVAQVAQVIDLL